MDARHGFDLIFSPRSLNFGPLNYAGFNDTITLVDGLPLSTYKKLAVPGPVWEEGSGSCFWLLLFLTRLCK